MSTTCVTPTFTEVSPTYGIFPEPMPPCLPDSETQLVVIATEADIELLTEDGLTLLMEG